MNKISDKELLDLLTKSEDTELSGSYGKVITINDNELLKVYYRLFKQDFTNCTLQDLKDDLIKMKTFSSNGTMSYKRLLADENRIIKLLELLNKTSSKDLIKDYIKYEEFVVALILSNYKDYDTYEYLIFNDDLSKKDHKLILEQIKEKVYELIENRLYPLDLKCDNIMVNKENLNVKLIDLDDLGTMFLDSTHSKSYERSVKFKLDHLEYKVLKRY